MVFIPCWPQPGLVPRNSERSAKLEAIAFKGYSVNLNSAFKSQQWVAFLQEQGIRWAEDSTEWQGNLPSQVSTSWNDYSEVDLILAVREDTNDGYENKPASKLVNAWMAGAPALLGPEYAYREMRRSELDYIEVSTVDEAIEAVERLKSRPDLYLEMIENGKERAGEFTREKLTERWASLLFEELPRLASSPTFQFKKRLPTRLKALMG